MRMAEIASNCCDLKENLRVIVKRNEELCRNDLYASYGNCANVDVAREGEREREAIKNNLKRENICFNNRGRGEKNGLIFVNQ